MEGCVSNHKSIKYLAIHTVNNGPFPQSVSDDWDRIVKLAQELVKKKSNLVLNISEE